MKKTQPYLIAFALLLCGFLGLGGYTLFTPVITASEGYSYYVHPGASKHSVITELAEQGVFKHPTLLSFFLYPLHNTALKKGEYFFPADSTTFSIWRQITTGTGLLYHPFKIVPGMTFKQIRTNLLNAEGLRHLTASMDDRQIMEKLGDPNVSPEGEFYPDTYYYTRGDVDLVLLKHAFNLMQTKLQALWLQRATGLPYKSPYEALIVASMIEKEGYLDAERPRIASVILNRLRKDMLLQIDATVIYGLADHYDGKIHKENLTQDTPYNTYLHKGLPPTPIAMPGWVSLQAALHPEESDFYYYVAKGDGSHQFSTNLKSHNEAIQSIQSQSSTASSAVSPPATVVTPIQTH